MNIRDLLQYVIYDSYFCTQLIFVYMNKQLISAAAFFGMTAVILGAFGAHWLKTFLDINELATFETGVRYQIYHAFLLFIISFLPNLHYKVQRALLLLVSTGIVMFSGSIYLLATNSMTSFDFRAIGFITPIGGFLLISAWLWIFVNFVGKKSIK